jgi:transcriptional regulator with XRE-family HTH domain
MVVLKHKGRPKGPNKAKDHITRVVIDALDATGFDQAWLCRRAGLSKDTLSRWRSGMENPRTFSLSLILVAAGLGFKVIDSLEPPQKPIRLPSLNQIRKISQGLK